MNLKDQMNGRGERAGRRVELRDLQRQAAQAQTGAAETVVWVPLEDLIVDERIQVRAAGLDDERVQQYANAMIEYGGWGSFPPLDVFRDPETNELRIAGGFHRRDAANIANQGLIAEEKFPVRDAPCAIHPGGLDEAIEFAEEDNLKHGLNLTARDKRGIFERRMAIPDHPWTAWSNRRIAAELGVSEFTIRNWRKELTAINIAVDDPPVRIGQDGRAINVAGIQEAHSKPKPLKSVPERDVDEQEPVEVWEPVRINDRDIEEQVIAVLLLSTGLARHEILRAVQQVLGIVEHAQFSAVLRDMLKRGVIMPSALDQANFVLAGNQVAQSPAAPSQAEQRLRAIVEHLRTAAEGLSMLGDEYTGETQQVGDLAEGLAEEWNL